MLSARRRSWSSSTKMNSASLSTKRRISQGQATRSTLTFFLVIHFISLLLYLLKFSDGYVMDSWQGGIPGCEAQMNADTLLLRFFVDGCCCRDILQSHAGAIEDRDFIG